MRIGPKLCAQSVSRRHFLQDYYPLITVKDKEIRNIKAQCQNNIITNTLLRNKNSFWDNL